jgi:hypothetical protein
LNTSVSGIEGSSNHKVSIPLMKASISTALPAASKSGRNWPSLCPRLMMSVMMSAASR